MWTLCYLQQPRNTSRTVSDHFAWWSRNVKWIFWFWTVDNHLHLKFASYWVIWIVFINVIKDSKSRISNIENHYILFSSRINGANIVYTLTMRCVFDDISVNRFIIRRYLYHRWHHVLFNTTHPRSSMKREIYYTYTMPVVWSCLISLSPIWCSTKIVPDPFQHTYSFLPIQVIILRRQDYRKFVLSHNKFSYVEMTSLYRNTIRLVVLGDTTFSNCMVKCYIHVCLLHNWMAEFVCVMWCTQQKTRSWPRNSLLHFISLFYLLYWYLFRFISMINEPHISSFQVPDPYIYYDYHKYFLYSCKIPLVKACGLK